MNETTQTDVQILNRMMEDRLYRESRDTPPEVYYEISMALAAAVDASGRPVEAALTRQAAATMEPMFGGHSSIRVAWLDERGRIPIWRRAWKSKEPSEAFCAERSRSVRAETREAISRALAHGSMQRASREIKSWGVSANTAGEIPRDAR